MSVEGNNSSQTAQPLPDELLQFCKSDSLSEEGLREIIERHGLRPHNANISDYDFFFDTCNNERVDERIIRCILDYFPVAACATNDNGWSSLHIVCDNKNVTFDIIQLLIDAAPGAVRSIVEKIGMPLHILCANKNMNEKAAIEILKLLLEKYPESIQHTNKYGRLPLHIASMYRSSEFCRMLIKAYPGSEWISTSTGLLPLHCACASNNLGAVECLYKLYPNAINHVVDKRYPIHWAIEGLFHGDSPMATLNVVKFLLDCDTNVKLQKFKGMSLLYYACRREYKDSNIEASIQVIRAIYDAHPEAIEEDRIASEIHNYHQKVQTFIEGELVHARQAKDRSQMIPDENGQLPLHRALQSNVTLGSIKLLVKGNPSAIRCSDTNSVFPLHLACQYHDSPTVIQYLLDLDPTTLRHVDYDNNTALHYACGGAKYRTIAVLLERYDAASVSRRNAQEKLPIELLLESSEVEDRESAEYTESVFLLLKAYPEMLLGITMQANQNIWDDSWYTDASICDASICFGGCLPMDRGLLFE